MKVLLLDDDAFLRDLYATKLTEAGHTVETSTDGQDALAKIGNDSFDVVLLDLIVPGMDGIEFITAARQLPNAARTAFVVLSNQSEAMDRKRATDAGAAGYIVKAEHIPSDVVALVASLTKSG